MINHVGQKLQTHNKKIRKATKMNSHDGLMDPSRELLQLCDTNSWKRGTRSEPVAGITLVHLESLIQVKHIGKLISNRKPK